MSRADLRYHGQFGKAYPSKPGRTRARLIGRYEASRRKLEAKRTDRHQLAARVAGMAARKAAQVTT